MLFHLGSRNIFFKSWNSKCVILFSIFILSTVFYIAQTGLSFQRYDSFQRFSYPSNENFYKILESNDSKSIPKLFDYQPRLMISPNPNKETDINIIIIVKSSIHNVYKRNGIRNSWASGKCKLTHQYQVYFALGQIDVRNEKDERAQKKIVTESEEKGDILQFDFIDTYNNNTYKVLSIMDYFSKSHPNVSYLVITDDDYFIDPVVLGETIANDITTEQYPRYLGGYVWYQTKPVRNSFSKWFVSYEKYRFEYYPPYPSGGFLLISNPMVKVLHRLLPYLKYNSIDDIIVGILLFKLKIYPTHLNNVYIFRPEPFPQNVLACHTFSNDLQIFWEKNHYDKKCVKRVFKRNDLN